MQASTATEKDGLRTRFRAARSAMVDAVREQARTAIREEVVRHVAANGWRCVAAYVPFRTEPGSRELLEALGALGARVIVPVTLPDRDLDWAPWSADRLGPLLGRDAIADADLVLVPALAVARDGTRLGRGGGSYDRALARCGAGTPIAALLFAGELVGSLPRAEWDRSVTAVVTPVGWQSLE